MYEKRIKIDTKKMRDEQNREIVRRMKSRKGSGRQLDFMMSWHMVEVR